AVGLVLAVADYSLGTCMLISNRALIDDMFLATDLTTSNATNLFERYHGSWGSPHLAVNLSVLFVVRYVASAMSATVAIPNGIFTPAFALGAVLGRLFGEALASAAPDSWVIVPAGYAIVGAASFTAGVTGTFSIAVIVFELTQQFTYMIPVLLSVLVGRAIAGFISLDMYETIARDKNLPQWPDLTRQASYALVASDLMHPVPVHVITRHQSLSSLSSVLDAATADVDVFPVVDDATSVDTPTRQLGLTGQLAVAGLTDRQAKELRLAGDRVDLVSLELLSLDAENVHVHRDSFASKVILLISVHKTPQLFVTGKGKLIGVIYAQDLVSRSRYLAL
ncbi:hypothetical protein AaE_008723, partial [Aphanomyces astaci]